MTPIEMATVLHYHYLPKGRLDGADQGDDLSTTYDDISPEGVAQVSRLIGGLSGCEPLVSQRSFKRSVLSNSPLYRERQPVFFKRSRGSCLELIEIATVLSERQQAIMLQVTSHELSAFYTQDDLEQLTKLTGFQFQLPASGSTARPSAS